MLGASRLEKAPVGAILQPTVMAMAMIYNWRCAGHLLITSSTAQGGGGSFKIGNL